MKDGSGSCHILTSRPVFHLNYPPDQDQSDEFALKGHTSACLTAETSPTARYLATGGWLSFPALGHQAVGSARGPGVSLGRPTEKLYQCVGKFYSTAGVALLIHLQVFPSTVLRRCRM